MAAKQDAAILQRMRQLRDDWMALPPGDARVTAIRDYMSWVCALVQDLHAHTALAEIASHAVAGVIGDDREARRERVLKGYPAMLDALRPILPTAETDLFIGDLKTMDEGRAPIALYPRDVRRSNARLRRIQELIVLKMEYEAGAQGLSRTKVLELRNVHGKPPLPLSRLNRWALRLPPALKQLHYEIGVKSHTGVPLDGEDQKLREALERSTLEEMIHFAIVIGGLSGGRPRYRLGALDQGDASAPAAGRTGVDDDYGA